jgi:hypothetical protein
MCISLSYGLSDSHSAVVGIYIAFKTKNSRLPERNVYFPNYLTQKWSEREYSFLLTYKISLFSNKILL